LLKWIRSNIGNIKKRSGLGATLEILKKHLALNIVNFT